jgi:hypothetical protein
MKFVPGTPPVCNLPLSPSGSSCHDDARLCVLTLPQIEREREKERELV